MGPIFGLIGQIFFWIVLVTVAKFFTYFVFLALVDRLKCVDSKTILDFCCTSILRALNWLRKQKGMIQLPYGTNSSEQ